MCKRKKLSSVCSGMLALMLAVTAPFDGAVTAFGAGAADESSADSAGGAFGAEQKAEGTIDFVTEKITKVVSEGTGVSSLRSITESLRQYEWDCYSSDYYYGKLADKEQLLYERLDAVCGELMAGKGTAATYKVKSNGKVVTRRGTKTVSTLGLTQDQVKKVQSLFVYSNPQYYYLNTILFTTNKDSCALGIYDTFADGNDRAAATEEVFDRLEDLQVQVQTGGSLYETDSSIHDLICAYLIYLNDKDALSDYTDPYYTQSVYGALMEGDTVCAGYTKLYVALANYFGIDCIAVTSDTHAWNQVRYGDHWYIVDLTWDDTTNSKNYSYLSRQQMKAKDQDSDHVEKSYYEGILPAADTAISNSVKALKGLEQPQVEVKDTATGLTITMESGEGDIYYTLDGTDPTSADIYTEPITLTDSGTYIVTAVVAREGMLASAYEIFPVRIAGGNISISSAVNASGKKIKVQYKSKKSFAGYEVSYASKKDFRNQKSAKVKGTAVTISGLKKGTTYYIRVRGYKTDAYGNYYYTPYSKAKKVKVTK